MNREKLKAMRPLMKHWEQPASMGDLAVILDALLEAAPDVGPRGTMTGHWMDGTKNRLHELRQHVTVMRDAEEKGTFERSICGAVVDLLGDLEIAGMVVVDHGTSPNVGPVAWFRQTTLDLVGITERLSSRLTALEAYRRGEHVDPDLELQAGALIVPLARRVTALEAYRKADDAYGLEVDGSLKALEERFDRLATVARKWRQVSPALSIFADLFDALLEARDVGHKAKEPVFDEARVSFRGQRRGQWQRGEQPEEIYGTCVDCERVFPRRSWAEHRRRAHPDVGEMHTPDRAHTEFAATMRSGQPWMNEWRRATEKATANLTPAPDRPQSIDPPEPFRRGATPCPVCGSNLCLGEARACDQRAAARKARG